MMQTLKSVGGLFTVALFIRLAMIGWGLWQDATLVVKYTDVDYEVVTDGARLLLNGQSPYDRATYRYTPLLAYLMTPNVLVAKDFGKLIFVFGDVLIGILLYWILKRQQSQIPVVVAVSVWLLNPIAINVSTRGNSEAVVGSLVLLALYSLLNNHYILAGIWYGLAVHFKIYPAVFCLALYLFVDSKANSGLLSIDFWKSFITKNRFKFAFASAVTFALLTAAMFQIYGWPFLHETYLYHLSRKDNRHNFSVYFYSLYLEQRSPEALLNHPETALSIWRSRFNSFVSFSPQLLIMLVFSFKFYRRIGLCLFLQTLAFVAFNKVCTVQYFIWYFSLLPLAICESNLKLKHYISLFVLWAVTQATWLYSAYLLEFQGQNTFLQVWIAGILFFLANCAILAAFILSTPRDSVTTTTKKNQ